MKTTLVCSPAMLPSARGHIQRCYWAQAEMLLQNLQDQGLVACMASSPGRSKTSQMFRSASCAARCSRLEATSGQYASLDPAMTQLCDGHAQYCWVCRYILVYPQGCDVCNHLSLFLCVADYDKLLPGDADPLLHLGLLLAPARLQADWQSGSGRLEPLLPVHHRSREQGPQEVQVFRCEAQPAQQRHILQPPKLADTSRIWRLSAHVMQTRCTASARRSMTGAGRSSWS